MNSGFCSCTVFKLWYEDERCRVCECGHRDLEHLDGIRSCVGEVEVRE